MSDMDLAGLAQAREDISTSVRRLVIGQQAVLDDVMIALFAGGHALLVGVPGLAKTRLIKGVAGALGLNFRRVQFTPDLMPSDITGTEVLEEEVKTGRRVPRFIPGPVFTNILLADEINRTPPRTQAALLEAMQEKQVSVGNETRVLQDPFFVLATQNPIEQEGTYPLPEAQLDRFMLQIQVAYPAESEEQQIALLDPVLEPEPARAVLNRERLIGYRNMVRGIVVAETIAKYAVALVRATRPDSPTCPADLRPLLAWGAGPRAGQYLLLAARVRAALHGNLHVGIDDLQAVIPSVMRHRVLPSYLAEAEGVSADALVARLRDAVPSPA